MLLGTHNFVCFENKKLYLQLLRQWQQRAGRYQTQYQELSAGGVHRAERRTCFPNIATKRWRCFSTNIQNERYKMKADTDVFEQKTQSFLTWKQTKAIPSFRSPAKSPRVIPWKFLRRAKVESCRKESSGHPLEVFAAGKGRAMTYYNTDLDRVILLAYRVLARDAGNQIAQHMNASWTKVNCHRMHQMQMQPEKTRQ